MSPLVRYLAQYAAYHRNARNIVSHLIGIPIIVFAVEVLLSRPHWSVGSVGLTPALLLSIVAAIFYIRLNAGLGAIMAVMLALACWAGSRVAGLSTGPWLGVGIGSFVIGWIIQFVGHAYEGRKPAFLDDVIGLIVGPLFILAEIMFALGAYKATKVAVDRSLATDGLD